MTTALTDYSGFERQLATLAQNSTSLEAQSNRLTGEIKDAEAAIAEKRRAIFENEALIASNHRKSIAINNLIRDFTDADTMRHRALEDYSAGV